MGACAHHGGRTIASAPVEACQRTPKTLVFLLHGIGGKSTAFEHMGEALTKHLNAETGTKRRFEVHAFIYDTPNDGLSTWDFARAFGNFIDSSFGGDRCAEDQISIVGHSQGGIIALRWLEAVERGDEGYHAEYAPHLDAYLTIATPFWGAGIASTASAISDNQVGLAKVARGAVRMGLRQLQDLSHGSQAIADQREYLIRKDAEGSLRPGLRVLNIGGFVKNPTVLPSRQIEGDGVVPVGSSQMNFIYARVSGRDVVPEDFRRTELAPYALVDGLHRQPLPPAMRNIHGLSQVPESCVKTPECSHPTFWRVFGHLLGRPEAMSNGHKLGERQGFLVDVLVRMPPGVDASGVRLRAEKTPQAWVDSRLAGEERQPASAAFDMARARFVYRGSISPNLPVDQREIEIPMTITGEGVEERKLRVKVRPAYSTFVDVDVEVAAKTQ